MPQRDRTAVWVQLVAERVDADAPRGGDDLAIEEPAVASLDRRGLALDRVAVLLFPADLLSRRDILGRLAHRDVDVRVFLRVAGYELWVVGVRRVRVTAAVTRHALDADRQEDVALTRRDSVRRHSGGHQRRGAVAVDRHAGDVEPG